MTNLTGQTLGRYRILEVLGEGGMAVVYKAYDTRLGRNVALKVMLPAANPQPALLRRFELEARALAQLSHPAIVRVLDYGEERDFPFLVLEYIPSGTLKSLLASGPGGTARALPWQEAAALLAPIARALESAHQRGIIHRDVKPSNILISETGQPLLSDFGIAKTLESEATTDITATGARMGTPEYMSPEQCLGSPVDYRTDIYSLGVVFYEMVTGRKPFTAESPVTVMHRQVYDPLPPPRQYLPGLAGQVEQVLYRALAKDPQDRFQTMGEFATALETLARGEVANTTRPAWPRPSGTARRPRIPLPAVLLVALLLVAALAAMARPLFRNLPGRPLASPSAPAQASTGWKQGRLALVQRQGSFNALFVLNLAGNLQPRLLFAADGKQALAPVWAKDGRRIAYYVYPNDLRVIDANADQPSKSVGNCSSPTWSPDGKRILCITSGGGPFIIYSLSGNTPAGIVPNATGNTPAWSPSHNEVVYSSISANKGGSNIWRTSLDSNESFVLVETGGENFAPSWSPDGEQVAYQSDQGSDNSEIWVMGRGGENPHRITTSPARSWSRGPTWSPDGKWIAFVSNQAGSIGADYGEVFVVSIKTGEVIQVTQTGGKVYDWRVSWTR